MQCNNDSRAIIALRCEVIMNIRKNSPAFAEHIILNALCRNGSAEDVLRQYLKCGYNCICMTLYGRGPGVTYVRFRKDGFCIPPPNLGQLQGIPQIPEGEGGKIIFDLCRFSGQVKRNV